MSIWNRIRFHPNVRRLVFWISLGVMLIAAVTGLVWRIATGEFGSVSLAALTLGIGALLVAVVFGLLEFANPMFHPESHLFDWGDVDSLRELTRRQQLDAPTREWLRSLADRIAVVLPGRPAPAQGQSQPKTPAVRRP